MRVLSDLESEGAFYRNSYRYLKYHIYEVVKLNQIKLNQFNCSESEKIFKAFIEHDLV